MVRTIDALSLERSGQERIAEHQRERAVALLKAGQNLCALDALRLVAPRTNLLSGTTSCCQLAAKAL